MSFPLSNYKICTLKSPQFMRNYRGLENWLHNLISNFIKPCSCSFSNEVCGYVDVWENIMRLCTLCKEWSRQDTSPAVSEQKFIAKTRNPKYEIDFYNFWSTYYPDELLGRTFTYRKRRSQVVYLILNWKPIPLTYNFPSLAISMEQEINSIIV
jgi:hypothetical protein